MNIREFRANLAQSLDKADNGSAVELVRNGKVYTLKRTGTVRPARNVTNGAPDVHIHVYTGSKGVHDVTPVRSVELCPKDGTPLTSFGRCLQKGCKYA